MRQPYFTVDVEFADLLEPYRYADKLSRTSIGEWVMDINEDLMFEDLPFDDNHLDLIHDHLREKHRLSNAFIRTFKEQIAEYTDRAYGDAYRSQYEADFLDFLESSLTFKADEASDSFTWRWKQIDKPTEYFYEATCIEITATKKQFYERFNKSFHNGYTTHHISQRLRGCDEDRNQLFQEMVLDDIKPIDPEDFDGRYGHFPNVKDDDIKMCFDDYGYHELFPLKKPYFQQIKHWIQNKVPLNYRHPYLELNYEIHPRN